MVFVSVVLHKGRLWIHEDGACIFTAALNKVIPMSILRQKTSQARLFEKMYTDYISAKFSVFVMEITLPSFPKLRT